MKRLGIVPVLLVFWPRTWRAARSCRGRPNPGRIAAGYEAACRESVSSVFAPREKLEFPQHFLKPHPSKLGGASDIERVISEHQGQYYQEMTPAQIARARAIAHPDPDIELRADHAIVRVVIFSNWNGFVRRAYAISRAFPHEILNVKDETLMEYYWGIIY